MGLSIAALRAIGLYKKYGNIVALNGVDLEIPRNAIFGLLGPNGAGKSTLIRIAIGLIRQDRGSIEVLGMDPQKSHTEILSRVGYVPETPSLPEFMSAEEYLEFTAKLYGMGSYRERIREVLSLVGLENAARRKIGTYSKGMTQRLAIAQAILPDPELLILDEPLMGIDPEARIEFKELFINLARRGRTILYSSHVLEEVERVSTHIAIINRGRIAAVGTKEELSTMLRGEKIVEVEIYENSPPDIKSLEGIEGVIRVSIDGPRIRVYVGRDADDRAIRMRISEEIHRAGRHIVEMRLVTASIEELFLRAIGRIS